MAGHAVSLGDVVQRGLDLGADLLGPPAARAETATAGRVGRGRRVTLQHDANAAPARSTDREWVPPTATLCIRVRGSPVQLRSRGQLDDLAEVHHRNTMAEVTNHRQVVGDEQVRQPELVAQPLQQADDLGLNADIECGHGLVEGDQVRRQGEGAGYADALPLAAGELVRVPIGGIRTELHLLEQFVDAFASAVPTSRRARAAARPRSRRPSSSGSATCTDPGTPSGSADAPRADGSTTTRSAQRRRIEPTRCSARSGEVRSGRSCSCRSLTRRPTPAPRRRRMSKETPDTAYTVAGSVRHDVRRSSNSFTRSRT